MDYILRPNDFKITGNCIRDGRPYKILRLKRNIELEKNDTVRINVKLSAIQKEGCLILVFGEVEEVIKTPIGMVSFTDNQGLNTRIKNALLREGLEYFEQVNLKELHWIRGIGEASKELIRDKFNELIPVKKGKENEETRRDNIQR